MVKKATQKAGQDLRGVTRGMKKILTKKVREGTETAGAERVRPNADEWRLSLWCLATKSLPRKRQNFWRERRPQEDRPYLA